jgi:hypothetical protein
MPYESWGYMPLSRWVWRKGLQSRIILVYEALWLKHPLTTPLCSQ